MFRPKVAQVTVLIVVVLYVILYHEESHLIVPIDEILHVKVVIIISSEGINHGLGHLEPAEVKYVLKHEENWDIEVKN